MAFSASGSSMSVVFVQKDMELNGLSPSKPQPGKMLRLPSGKVVLRRAYERFYPIANYINWHPDRSTRWVAEKFGVPVSSLRNYMHKIFPNAWSRHCRACAKARRRRLYA